MQDIQIPLGITIAALFFFITLLLWSLRVLWRYYHTRNSIVAGRSTPVELRVIKGEGAMQARGDTESEEDLEVAVLAQVILRLWG